MQKQKPMYMREKKKRQKWNHGQIVVQIIDGYFDIKAGSNGALFSNDDD